MIEGAGKGWNGWDEISGQLKDRVMHHPDSRYVISVECYHGVQVNEILDHLRESMPAGHFFKAEDALLEEAAIQELIYPYVTDDPVFGYITRLELHEFFDKKKITAIQNRIEALRGGLIVVIGTGASLIVPNADLQVYADMPRWEIQLRFRRNETGNLGSDNRTDAFSYQYKRAFFVDWRVCDRYKIAQLKRSGYVLDTTLAGNPKMIRRADLMTALDEVVQRPFRVVPFFDPGPWGGQWLKEVFDLETAEKNIAWGFDCVPEENSLLLRFGSVLFETPSVNLVFYKPEELLGKKVYEAFGAEFPIRFDFLDTMEGGNLSLQVHPLKEYIREKFGMAYTQDESYYFLQAREDAFVYLGLKDNIIPEKMIHSLQASQHNGENFDADSYVEKWPVKKHDHVSIPSGTIHCSGANSVVLEISATPYIFTFKLWDWRRMGLDGKPRPISLEHGSKAIQWERTRQWTEKHILHLERFIGEGEGWREESTGLDENSFIETRRHWFTGPVPHHTNGVFNILNLIEGREAIVESPSGAFSPFIVHYAETFIVPAGVGAYTIRPYGESIGKECATIKAYVRTEKLIDHLIN